MINFRFQLMHYNFISLIILLYMGAHLQEDQLYIHNNWFNVIAISREQLLRVQLGADSVFHHHFHKGSGDEIPNLLQVEHAAVAPVKLL